MMGRCIVVMKNASISCSACLAGVERGDCIWGARQARKGILITSKQALDNAPAIPQSERESHRSKSCSTLWKGAMTDVVFFDMGGTLLYPDPTVPEVFAIVARRMGHDITVRDVEPCMADVDAYYQDQYMKDGDFWCVHERAVQIWLDMYTMMADYCGITEGVPELAQAVYDDFLLPENWALFPDVQACLKGLKRRGFRLGVISNWDATLVNLVRSLGLLPYFDEVIASAAVGCRKPHKAVFEIALERMGATPDQAVHVGDLPEADGEGAVNAGLRPVLIDRHNRFADAPFERVSLLTDLVSLL